jgi:hypothetical protein
MAVNWFFLFFFFRHWIAVFGLKLDRNVQDSVAFLADKLRPSGERLLEFENKDVDVLKSNNNSRFHMQFILL